MVECTSLENWQGRKALVGSNPTPSANNLFKLLNGIVIYYSLKSYPYFYPCRPRRANCTIAGVLHPRIGLARIV